MSSIEKVCNFFGTCSSVIKEINSPARSGMALGGASDRVGSSDRAGMTQFGLDPLAKDCQNVVPVRERRESGARLESLLRARHAFH
jgi:hypothetical protein